MVMYGLCTSHDMFMYSSCMVHVRSAQGFGEVKIILTFIVNNN